MSRPWLPGCRGQGVPTVGAWECSGPLRPAVPGVRGAPGAPGRPCHLAGPPAAFVLLGEALGYPAAGLLGSAPGVAGGSPPPWDPGTAGGEV